MIRLLLTLFRGIASVILAMTLLDYYFALYADPYDDGDGYMRGEVDRLQVFEEFFARSAK